MSNSVISEKKQNEDGDWTWIETDNTPEGPQTRLVIATPWKLDRTNCFCCSCDESDYGMIITDPYCRNHGYGFGERPCEVHNMPGSPIDREVLTPHLSTEMFIGPEPMPPSVQAVRRQRDGDH